MGKFAVAGAAALVGATVAIGAGLLDLAKDAAPLQGIGNAFKALANSAGQNSDKLLASMEKASMGMVTDSDLMLQYNKSAQLVGGTLAGQLPDAYQYLAKVAASSGQDVGQLMDTLVNGVGRVTPKMMTQLGVTIDAKVANEAYAASIGKSVTDLTKADKQTALFNATMTALKKNTAGMPDVTNNASTKMAQFNVKMADMKEHLGTALLPMLGSFMDLMSGLADTVLPIITPIIETIGNGFTNFFNALKEGFNPIEALGEAFTRTLPAGAAIGDLFKNISDWVTTIALPALQKLANWFVQDALPAVISFITGTVVPAVQAFFTFLGNAWAVVGPALGKIADFFIHDVLPAVVGFVRDTVIPAVQGFINILKKVWDDVSPFLSKLGEWFQTTVLPAVVHYVKDVVMVAIQDWINLLKSIWTLIEPTLTKVYQWFITNGLPAITTFLQGAMDNFITPFINLLAGIFKVVGPILDDLKNWFVKDGLPGITNFINDAMKNFITPLINLLKGLWDQVKVPLQSVVDWFKNTFSTIANFIQPILNLINDVINKAGQAISWLQQLGGGAPTQTAAQIVQSNINDSNIASSGGFGGARAAGGAVRAGKAYMVGERGPEPFIPSTNGTIIPNDKAMGGNTINLQSLVINASGAAEGAAAGHALTGALDEWISRGNR